MPFSALQNLEKVLKNRINPKVTCMLQRRILLISQGVQAWPKLKLPLMGLDVLAD